MIKKIALPIIILFFLNNKSLGQEYTTFTSVNAEIKKHIENKSTKSNKQVKSRNILELPFWDDFSYEGVYADPVLWEINDKVYINSTLANEAPSIGVATFDALNESGEVYPDADYEIPFIADFLTSDSINLNYPGDNTIYLSFYYKPQGIGDAPDPQDSLILEFYAPEEETWYWIWSVEGSDNSDFQFIILPVNEDKYLKTGFKFRFKNYASLGSDTYPSLASNCDYWHIDYVYLNKDRNSSDSVFHDIAFNKPLHSLINGYEAVPWSHYKSSSSDLIKDTINVAYKNNDNATRLIDSLNFTLTDESGLSANQIWKAGSYTPPPFKQEYLDLPGQILTFQENSNEFADFTLKAKLVTDTYDSICNNSISYTQKFRDYYAYDDGSAEAGYGIYGNGTKYGSVAYKFDPIKSDYLTGVSMYFTRTLNDASQKYFWIYIWEVDEVFGIPGDTIRTFEGNRPEYEDELNRYHLYKFDSKIPIDGPFFIGWTQTTEDKLNIGFDYNNISNDKLYYNTAGDWIPSVEIGAVMIRPVFGDFYGTVETTDQLSLKVYPNPADKIIYIEFNTDPFDSYNLSVYDIQGRQLINISNFSEKSISVNDLPRGLYLIRISDSNNKTFSSKFIKQ